MAAVFLISKCRLKKMFLIIEINFKHSAIIISSVRNLNVIQPFIIINTHFKYHSLHDDLFKLKLLLVSNNM